MDGRTVLFKTRGRNAREEAQGWVDEMRESVNREGLESYESLQDLAKVAPCIPPRALH